MLEQRQRRLTALCWWSLAAGLAAALKAYFSAAATAELDWMLRPLSALLQLITGWRFAQNEAGEWYSFGAGIVLVKACAGINFMILSFIGWCRVWRPRRRGAFALAAWPLFMGGALVFAWVTALIANTLRVLAIVHWQPGLEQWVSAGQAHRALGLAVYLPALTLQLLLTDWSRRRQALPAAASLYALLMLGVPLLTGNAAASPVAYAEHALMSLAALLPLAVAGYCWQRRHRS